MSDLVGSVCMRRFFASLVVVVAAVATGVGAASAGAAGKARSAATMSLSAQHANGRVGAVLADAPFGVSGVVSEYSADQFVSIHVFDNGQRIRTVRVPVLRQGSHGVFHLALHVAGVGHLTVHAIHFANRQQSRIVSNFVSVWVVAPQVAPGVPSLAARILQSRLEALHYVVGAPGILDSQTQLAVLAFQKLAGLPLTAVPDAAVFTALAAGHGSFAIKFPAHGRHVEADLTHQVLALIGADGQVQSLYDMSSGKPTTPTAPGSFSVYSKTPGVNSLGMVDSSYFNGGDAIHGYAEVPPYAASHGCLRVPIPDALTIFDWVAVGTPVDVYFR
jgi:L,D-transpeptidase catalytic domain/Putative peptidoglycan binding domain